MPRLTPQTTKSLPPGAEGQRIDYRDKGCPGLVLRVGPGGRSYYFTYSLFGHNHRMRLGEVSERGLAARRKEVRQLRGQVSAGKDPREARRAAAASANGETFQALGERALAAIAEKVRPKTHREMVRMFHRDLVPAIGKVNPREPVLLKIAVLKMGDKLAKKAPYVANRAVELARRIISWAITADREGVYVVNPLLRLSKPTKEAVRERLYTDDEVKAIVAGAEGTLYQDVVRLLLATGVRADEVMGAAFSEFNVAERTWWVPAERSKVGVARPVALNAFAISVLKDLQANDDGSSGFLFPAPTVSGRRERAQKVIRQVRDQSGVDDFRLHDLRRVVRAGLGALHVATDVAELALGHLPPKLVRVYSPFPSFWRLESQRPALEAWGERLKAILA